MTRPAGTAGLQTGTAAASRLLLTAANQLYRQTRKGDPTSFNLFTVLRSPADEVNLHSRFLHALLKHRTTEGSEFLADFLRRFCPDKCCDNGTTMVEREKHDIDILIINRRRWAIAIENKIGAGDQPSQLFRYHKTLSSTEEIECGSHVLLYLSPDGHEPSHQSLQGPRTESPSDASNRVPDKCWRPISYEELLPWLEYCQGRAMGNHGLHASITQYLQVVRETTGRHMEGQQMQTLKKLIRETGTIGIAREVGKAADEVRWAVVEELWSEIKSAVKKKLPEDFNPRTPPTATDRDRIKQTFGLKKHGSKKWHGLYFSRTKPADKDELGPAPALGVELGENGKFFFGVRCLRETYPKARAVEGTYYAVNEAVSDSPLAAEFERDGGLWWPCRRDVPDYPRLTDERLSRLSDAKEQKKVAEDIATQLRELWDVLQKDDRARNLF